MYQRSFHPYLSFSQAVANNPFQFVNRFPFSGGPLKKFGLGDELSFLFYKVPLEQKPKYN